MYVDVTNNDRKKINDTNLKAGSLIGSTRSIGSKKEDSSYKIGRYAMAEGLDTQSGAKAFTIVGVDKTNKTYTLDSVEGLSVGDVYSVHVLYTSGSSSQAENYGKITDINGNVVTVDNLWCEGEFATSNSYISDGYDGEKNTFRIIIKPNVGTRVIGDISHAEGVSTKALSKGSHAEGKGTVAHGSWSHAEGNNTKAGYGAHAEGNNTKATGFNSHAEGNNTTSSGFHSHAEGNRTTASGFISHAEGSGTTSSGASSHAEGDGTTSSGDNSHAEGDGTKAIGYASHAEGSRTEASGITAHAEGDHTVASGDASHAEGNGTTASGFRSHAEGSGTTSSGDNSHAEGWYTKASRKNSHAEGEHTVASGENSHAEGNGTTAYGYRSHAEGDHTVASGYNSHAEGWYTKASGNTAHAEGDHTVASGYTSHAEGNGTDASSFASHAEGDKTKAIGYASHAEGSRTEASGITAHTEGDHTVASGDASHAQGRYNISNDNYADVIGNGSSDTKRSNASTVDWNGNAWFAGDVYVGSTSGTNKDEGSKKLATEEYVNSAKTMIDDELSLTSENPVQNKVITKTLRDILDNTYISEDVVGIQVDYQNKVFKRLASAQGLNAGEDFNSFHAFGGRRRCNVAGDGTILAYYGDDNYADDGSNGQVMVYQPAFYYKVVPLVFDKNTTTGVGYHLRKANYYISDVPLPYLGFKLHPAFYDENGNEVEYVLMSAYEGSMYDVSASEYVNEGTNTSTAIEAGDLLCSVAGVKPISGLMKTLSKSNAEIMASNRGSGWHLETIKITSANQLLMMVELGTMNTQTAIGQGVVSVSGNSLYNCSSYTGSTASLGNTTGQATETVNKIVDSLETTYTTPGKLSITYRGVENPWGNIWKHIQGVNIWGDGTMGGGQPYIANNFVFSESKNGDNYEPVGFTLPNTNGYVNAMGYGSKEFDWLLMPSEVGGTSALPVGDDCYVTSNLSGYRIARLGGSWHYGPSAGGFFWHCNVGVDYRHSDVGGRLSYIPTSESTTTES